MVITEPSAPSHWLNAQSDWPGLVPMSNAIAWARLVFAMARSLRSYFS
jgi:hypothetical protein